MKAETWSSPYWVDGKVYIGNENGKMSIFEHGKEKKILATNIDMQTRQDAGHAGGGQRRALRDDREPVQAVRHQRRSKRCQGERWRQPPACGYAPRRGANRRLTPHARLLDGVDPDDVLCRLPALMAALRRSWPSAIGLVPPRPRPRQADKAPTTAPMFGGTIAAQHGQHVEKNIPDDLERPRRARRRTSSGWPRWAATPTAARSIAGGRIFVGTNNAKPRDPTSRATRASSCASASPTASSSGRPSTTSCPTRRQRLPQAGHRLDAVRRGRPALLRQQPLRVGLRRRRPAIRRRARPRSSGR